MYYNSNKSNSAYYNAYKEEMETLEDYNDEFSFQKIMKVGFIILALGLFSLLSIYLANYFSTEKKELSPSETISKTVETEDKLPKSVQVQEPIKSNLIETQLLAEVKVINKDKPMEKTTGISSKDIALIVEIILAQINTKEEISLEKQLLEAETNKMNTKTLKESNHYNKVVVATNNRETSILEKTVLSTRTPSSSYEQAIQKELDVRSNEMRIIIVQQGDTLSKIAKKAYGDIDAYPKIFMANPEILKNPDEIFVGQKLRIPA
jgi:LysM repeat protein